MMDNVLNNITYTYHFGIIYQTQKKIIYVSLEASSNSIMFLIFLLNLRKIFQKSSKGRDLNGMKNRPDYVSRNSDTSVFSKNLITDLLNQFVILLDSKYSVLKISCLTVFIYARSMLIEVFFSIPHTWHSRLFLTFI